MQLLTRWRFRLTLKGGELRQVFGFSGFVLAGNLVGTFQANAGVVVLARVLTATDVGYYSLALYLTDTVRRALMSILNRVTFVHYSQHKHDLARIREIFVATVTWNCRVLFPVMTAVMLFGPALAVEFLGPEWARLGSVIFWLSLTVIIGTAGGTTSNLYKGLGRPGLDLLLMLITTVGILFPALIVAGSLYGIEGAACATAVVKLIAVLLRMVILNRMIGSTTGKIFAVFVRFSLLQMPIFAAWVVARYALPHPHWITDIVLMGLGLAIYGLIELPRAFPTLFQRFGLAVLLSKRMPK